MIQTYIAYNFTIQSLQPAREILVAELGSLGFESFTETENGLVAYIPKSDWNLNILNEVFVLNSGEFNITYDKEEIKPVNWNKEWEKNFDPIAIDNKVSIRAPFHEKANLDYNILIEPKMSFGTGHHETTHLMVKHLLQLDLKNKTVLDMGCGTAVLAILAEMRGASKLDAIDIDSWCYENSIENIERNNSKKISVYEGDASLLVNKHYDLIIANINRNILLQDIKIYANSLNKKGFLLLSGFYQEDIPVIDAEASKYNLKLDLILERNNWAGLRYLME
ncbi:MAG TPA: 50S ribosomal protein L11 methyltransferase [Lutibacter sp.]|nr:50S ribosomal protein L11 methyltransferase [Lutibacter sp.]